MKVDNPLAFQAEFIQLGLPKLFKTFWADYLCVTSLNDWNELKRDSVEALYHMTMALWFISSNPTHREYMFNELAAFIMTAISGHAFTFFKSKRSQDCLKAMLGIIYQFSKHIDRAKDVVRENDGVKVLQRISANKSGFSKTVKSRAIMIFAFVLSEEEQKGDTADVNVMGFLIGLLKECLSYDDHRSKTYNYEALEILHGNNSLLITTCFIKSFSYCYNPIVQHCTCD